MLDVSASMHWEKRLVNAKEAARAFIDLLGAQDRALVVAFSDRPEVHQSLTGDKDKLKKSVSWLLPHGATALYDAVVLASDELRESEHRRVLGWPRRGGQRSAGEPAHIQGIPRGGG